MPINRNHAYFHAGIRIGREETINALEAEAKRLHRIAKEGERRNELAISYVMQADAIDRLTRNLRADKLPLRRAGDQFRETIKTDEAQQEYRSRQDANAGQYSSGELLPRRAFRPKLAP